MTTDAREEVARGICRVHHFAPQATDSFVAEQIEEVWRAYIPHADAAISAHITALAAQGLVIEKDWMPIETREPPRGAEVDLYFPPSKTGQLGLGEMWRTERWPWLAPRKPTHWRPTSRPAAPKPGV